MGENDINVQGTEQPTVNATPNNDISVSSTENVAEKGTEGVTEGIESDIRLGSDEKGNKTLIIEGNPFGIEEKARDEPTEVTEEATEPQTEETAEPVEEVKPAYYGSIDEIAQAQVMGTLDESKISPEHRQILMNIAVQNQYNQQRAEQLAKAQSQRELENQQAFKRISDEARQEAMKAVGISADDFANIQYMDNADETKAKFEAKFSELATAKMRDYLTQQIVAEQRANTHAQCMNEVMRFSMAEKNSEPHFDEITKLMDAEKMNMPYIQAQKIITAEQNINNGCCNANDLQAMREYYDLCKKKVYQQSAGVSKIPQRTAPPKVENVSQPNTTEKAPEIDFDRVRKLPTAERSRVMTDIIASMM